MPGTATTKDLDLKRQLPSRSRLSEVHHGRTPAAWVGTIGTGLGFAVGCIALIFPSMVGMWVGIGIVVVSVIATLVLRAAGYGAD